MSLIGYINTFIDFIYPRHCFSCDNAILSEGEVWEVYVCDRCRNEINIGEKNRCIKCGLALGPYTVTSNSGCMTCKDIKLGFDTVYPVTGYEGPTKKLIHRFKYGRNEALKVPIGKIMIESSRVHNLVNEIDLIIPVPLFWKKRIKRGFNQSALIAKQLARHYSIPISTGNLRRIRNTDTQAHLTHLQRVKNVEDAFDVRAPARFLQKNILLVDDVMTTGVTASECARMLKESGAWKVYVIVLARVDMKQD